MTKITTHFVALVCLLATCAFSSPALADEKALAVQVGNKYAAADTLDCGDETSEDAKECLNDLVWNPA